MYPGVFAAQTPDKPAVILAGSGESISFAELEERSVRASRMFHEAGLVRGDVVALLTDNALPAFEVYWAAIRSGFLITAVNHNLAPSEVEYILEDSGAKALVVSAATGDLARAVGDTLSTDVHRWSFGGPVEGYRCWEDGLAAAPAEPLPVQPRGTEMLYSSGTTGRPKGIRPTLPEGQITEVADPVATLLQTAFGLTDEWVYLSPAPLYHSAPLRWCNGVIASGATVVMMERFDPEHALATIERHRVTSGQFVPTMFVRMLKLPDETRARYDVSSLRIVIHAAAPCPVEVKQAMIDWWGPKLLEYYGASETHGVTTITSEQWLAHPGSVGPATLGILHICDDEGKELPTGEIGTVYFEREVMPFEYHNDPGKTSSSQHPWHPNWVTVGDLGYVDDDAYLYLTDRKTFMIISGGVNIYPQEIENVLALHPKITDIAVIGVPDEEMGESVKAVVQPAPGVQPGPELEREIIDFIRDRIAHFKAPRSVDFVDELPRTPTGKLVKGPLRQRYVDEYTRARSRQTAPTNPAPADHA